MGRPADYTAEEVIEAIQGTGGVKIAIARKLGVTRHTITNYINRWATVKAAYITEKRTVDDEAVSVLVDDIIQERNVSTAKWWVERKLAEFKPKQDVTSDGDKVGAIAIVNMDLDKLKGNT